MAYAPIQRWLSWSSLPEHLLSIGASHLPPSRPHAAFADLMVRSHMAVMPAQLPDLMSAAWQSQEPPTATTLGSASQAGALASPIPPVGQNLACGNGPASARSALMPPDCSAGKNLTRSKPWASAAISSEAVAMPGAK